MPPFRPVSAATGLVAELKISAGRLGARCPPWYFPRVKAAPGARPAAPARPAVPAKPAVLARLTAEGCLDHLPSSEYRPGVRVLTLGTAALRSLDLVELATPKGYRGR